MNLKNYLPRQRMIAMCASPVLAGVAFLLFSNTVFAQESSSLVNLTVEGDTELIATKADTVGQLLEKLEISLQEEDLVVPSKETELDAELTDVKVLKAESILVQDGNDRRVVYTPYEVGYDIAKNAGLNVFEEDEFKLSRITNFIEEGAVGVKLEIKRSTPYELDLYGESIETRTHAATVAEALEQKGVNIGEEDVVTPALDQNVKKDMVIKIARVNSDVVNVEEDVDFKIKQVQDDTQDRGYEKITSAGAKGKATVTYEITYENDVEIKREEINKVITQEPVEQVVTIGTKTVLTSTHIAGGTKEDWMRAAGIPESDWWAVDYIVSRESSWNPNAVNPGSGACGLAQQLPCGKWDSFGAWNDPVSALTAQYSYVNARYGGYGGAYNFWVANHWY